MTDRLPLWAVTVQASRLMALVGFLGLVGLALMTAVDILLRWLANAPIHGVNDVSAVVMVVVIAACLPANLAERQNITITFLGDAAGPRVKAALAAFGSLATLLFVALMAWRFVVYAHEVATSRQTTWVLALPIAPWWWAAAAFIVLSVPVQCVVVVADLMAAFGNGGAAEPERGDAERSAGL